MTAITESPFFRKLMMMWFLVIMAMLVVPAVDAGTISRTYTVAFAGQPVELAGFDETIRLWISVFLLIFVAMFAGASHAPQIAIVDSVLAWIFFGIGWLNPIAEGIYAKTGIGGETALFIALTFATIYAVIWNIREGKRKERGS